MWGVVTDGCTDTTASVVSFDATTTPSGSDMFYSPTKDCDIRIRQFEPSTKFIFSDGDIKEVGVLDWSSGELKFKGNIKNSARLLFKALQPYVDCYIKSKLEEKKWLKKFD